MRILTPTSSPWPQQLNHLHNPPKQLWLKGDQLSPRPRVAIVGSRKPTHEAILLTQQITTVLARQHVCIVSGLAYGIDIAAHRAALDVSGSTIAVLASGVHNPTPTRHAHDAQRIATQPGSCVLSEYPPTAGAHKYRFIERNRIVAALSDIVLVVEGSKTSGTRSTAEFALELGVEIAAIPGSPLNPLAATPNDLIAHGAHVVRSAQDVLTLLPTDVQIDTTQSNTTRSMHPLVHLLQQHGPQPLSQLEALYQQPALSELTELELAGMVLYLSNGTYTCTYPHGS